jgi:DNA polymerase-1
VINKKKKLLLLDGNSIICRYFYGIPEKKSPDGLNVNGVFGFTRFLCQYIVNEVINSSYDISIIICFDRAINNFRKEILGTYKQNRPPFPENFFYQMRLCEEICQNFNIHTDSHDRYEADDLIASYCRNFADSDNVEILIMSNDKDLLQLVSENKNIFLFNVAKKKYFNENEVLQTMFLLPKQIPEFLAIAGDASDNISGIFNVGPKTTIKLLHKYGNLEAIINSEEGHKKDFTSARKFLELTKLFENAPIKNCFFQSYDFSDTKIIDCLTRYGFFELLRYFI